MSILLIKLTELLENIFSALWQLLLGFRLTTWEISQLILSDVRIYERTSDSNKDTRLMYAVRIYSHASTLGFFHFLRGLRYAVRRDPSISDALSSSLQNIITTDPVTLDQISCHDYFFVIDRLKSFHHVVMPPARTLSSRGNQTTNALHKL